MSQKFRVHIFVSGLVQGVFFRSKTKDRAGELNLFGWVKNLDDGRVEILAEGEKERLEELIEWAKRGPELAKIDNFTVSWEKAQGEFEDFEIKYD